MEQIGTVGIILGALVVLSVAAWFLRSSIKEQKRRSEAQAIVDERLVNELHAEQVRLTERESAEPLFKLTLPERSSRDAAVPNYTRTIEKVNQLIADFKGLSTYQEVNVWDGEATSAADDLVILERALDERRVEFLAMIEFYKNTSTDSPNLIGARVEKSVGLISNLTEKTTDLSVAHDHLMACVEQTPGSKKEQALLLRELRTEKKELQARKKEIKSGAAQIRRDARQQSSEAGIGPYGLFGGQAYASKVAMWERRAIRREKESALAPHEDAVMAVDRQLAEVEKQITWLQKFGDEATSTA